MNVSPLPTTSLLLSVIIHLVIFNVFIFTFPFHPTAPKPNLIFLGPILKKIDVAQPVEAMKQKQPSAAVVQNVPSASPPLTTVMDKNKTAAQSPFAENTPQKPFMDTIKTSQDKVTLKSTFEIKEEVSEQQSEEGEIDFKIAPYHPLRLRRP